MREARIESKLKVEIERRGGLSLKFVSPGRAGAPDRLVLMPGGRLWFVELKAPGKRPRPLQEKRIAELMGRGFRVRVISSLGELEEFLREV